MPVGQTGEWNLIFDDTFEVIDTVTWETGWFSSTGFSPAVNGNGAACFHPDQLSTLDGNLVLTIDAEDDDGCRLKDGRQAVYVSGLINTRETFTFSYGYAEARMFLPSDGGPLHNWPAFWHTGFDWPLTGEVDVAEGLSGGALCSVYHHQGADGDPTQERGCVDWEDPGGWHVFAADWQPDRITFYYDGVEFFSTTKGVGGAPHYLIIDYTVRDDGSAVVPSQMLVDYVRVWQR